MRIVSLLLFALLLIGPAPARAHDEIVKGDLVIAGAWTRATPSGATVAGGYVTISNRGTSDERLVSFTTDLAAQPEVHEMTYDNGVMRMRPLVKGLVIPAGGTVKLEPGGYHLMLLQLKKPLTAGERFKATLVFEKAGPIEVEFEVRGMGHGGHQKRHHHGH
jgi:copper(I)-binding protein